MPKEDIGVATSFNTLMKYLGQTMMVSIYGIAFNTMVVQRLNKHPQLNQSMMNKIVIIISLVLNRIYKDRKINN